MPYNPSSAYYKEFVTSSATGAAANADSLPTATPNKNGTDDGAFTLTVANITTGRYKVTGTIPSGYVSGDVLNVSVAATIGGVAAVAVVDTQVISAASAAQTGDAYAVVTNGTYGLSAIKTILDAISTSVANINNLSALANLFVTPIMEVPESGYTDYRISLLVKDVEGHQVDVTGSPTLVVVNAQGVDRWTGRLFDYTRTGVGQYRWNYRVPAGTATESLQFTATGTPSDGEQRVAKGQAVTVDYDYVTALAAIQAKTDLIATNAADSPRMIQAATDAGIAATQATSAATDSATAATQAASAATALGTAGSGLTAIGDARVANLDAAVSTRATLTGIFTYAKTSVTDVASWAYGVINGITAGVPVTPLIGINSSAVPVLRDASIPAIANVTAPWTIRDANNDPVNLSGKTMRLVVFDLATPATVIFEIENANITVTGTDHNVVTVSIGATVATMPGRYKYQVWNVTDQYPVAEGKFTVTPSNFGA